MDIVSDVSNAILYSNYKFNGKLCYVGDLNDYAQYVAIIRKGKQWMYLFSEVVILAWLMQNVLKAVKK